MDSAAEWVGAIGTAGALLAAVYTLWRQVQADVRAQGQKIDIIFDSTNPQTAWSVENRGDFPVELHEIRAIFHHDRSVIGTAVMPGQNDEWRFMRSSGWRTTLTRAWALLRGSRLTPVNYPDARQTRGSWTTLTRGGAILQPNTPVTCPLPEYEADVGVLIRARFTDSVGRNWWRIWPTGELKSVWDPDFWSIRRTAYIFRTLNVLSFMLIAVAVSTIVISAPAWSIAISWIVSVVFSAAALRVFLDSRKFPIEFWGLQPLARRTQHLSFDGKRIAFDVEGNGPLIILSPGMGDLRSSYRALVSGLAGYQVVMADLRGHGDSDATFDSYGDRETSGDLLALVEHFGQNRVLLVASSRTAGSAILTAVESQDRIRGLVLIGPLVRDQTRSLFSRPLLRIALASPWTAAVWKFYLTRLYAGNTPDRFKDYRDSVISAMRRPRYAAAFAATAWASHEQVLARLADVSVPVMVIMGERDPGFRDARNEANWIAEQVHGKTVMVPNAGHYPHIQRPDFVNQEIRAFLEALPA